MAVCAGCRICHDQELVKCEAQVQFKPLNIKSGAWGVLRELDSWLGVPSILMALTAMSGYKIPGSVTGEEKQHS